MNLDTRAKKLEQKLKAAGFKNVKMVVQEKAPPYVPSELDAIFGVPEPRVGAAIFCTSAVFGGVKFFIICREDKNWKISAHQVR